jgi:CubicO group peptidase (beta-lactamase class C family)
LERWKLVWRSRYGARMPDLTHFAESPAQVGIDPEKLNALFARAEREVRNGLLPSMQLAIACRGRVAAMRTIGTVTHESRTAEATNDTLYVVFSCTKALTSTAGWILLQEGKLDVTERVADILPEFGSNGKDVITVEQLFTHTCGFPLAPFPMSEWNDRAKRRERFARWRLNWEPGSRFEYHPTSSMWVIAAIIEQRTGVDFREFVRTRIAEPLGLRDLYVGLPPALQGRLADIQHVGALPTAEEMKALGWPEIPVTEVTEDALQGFNDPRAREAGNPGGGGTMTAADLALFYQALLAALRGDDERIWKVDTVRQGLRVRTGDLTDPLFRKRVHRALGLVIAGDADRTYRGFGHTGSEHSFGHNGAGGQIAWADPDSGISFVYCTNGMDRHPIRQARRSVALSSLAAVCAA